MERTVYIDGTDVLIRNKDITTTECRYAGDPTTYVVDIGFALELIRDAFKDANLSTEKVCEVIDQYKAAYPSELLETKSM